MNTIPQHIWQHSTLHKFVTSLYGGCPEEIIIKLPEEYLPRTSGKKKNPPMKPAELRNTLNGSEALYAVRGSSSWGVRKPTQDRGTEDSNAGKAEVSSG